MTAPSLTLEERIVLCRLARQTLAVRLGKSAPGAEPVISPALERTRGAFVTLTIGGHLRGCIGTFRPAEPLHQLIARMVVAAAIHDPRFSPVTAAELEVIEIEISALTPLQPITDVSVIEIGVHGLYITSGFQSGVLLPQVAIEHGWSREEFLNQTCHKAGLPSNAWKHGATLEIFSAEVFSESHPEGGKVSCGE
jgi:AmmeMemoRadiSam system protein A